MLDRRGREPVKDYIIQFLAKSTTTISGRLLLREYLQARILEGLQEQGMFRYLAFLGGTALRFLFQLPRFSEGLDFSTIRPDPELTLGKTVQKIRKRFEAEGYTVATKEKKGTVVCCFIRFPGLLYEVGLSPFPDEVIAIKVEVDTNPPGGAGTETTLIRRHVLLNLFHYDRSSLLAGKLHALISRSYTKGRDLYDLMWYLTDPSWPEPNLELLNSALRQNGWKGPPLQSRAWRSIVEERLRELDWAIAVNDVRPFLERPSEASLLTFENLQQLLHR